MGERAGCGACAKIVRGKARSNAGFSFGTENLKHANFLREMGNDCRFSGVEVVFALEFQMFRTNRKLSAMDR